MPDLSARVAEAFRSLPARYLGAEPGFDATYHVRLGDIGRSWEVRCTALGARVRAGASRREPDVVIGTDAETWLQLREGELSGVEAFQPAPPVRARGPRPRGRLRGPVPAPQRPPAAAAHPQGAGRQAEDLHADDGRGPRHAAPARPRRDEVELLRHRRRAQPPLHRPRARPARLRRLVQARDRALRRPVRRPGRDRRDGRARHRAAPTSSATRWAAGSRSRSASSGPDRVGGSRCSAPPWRSCGATGTGSCASPARSSGCCRTRSAATAIERTFWALFADRDLVDPSVADIVVDEFERIYRSPGARLAFLSSARAIYLESPAQASTRGSRRSQPPALFVWASHDRLIPERFRPHVERWLPSAEQVVLEGCGHVPQVERPERTNGLLERFFARVDPLGGTRLQAA